MLCTVLCREKIEQVADKVAVRKKLNPRGGVLLSDFIDELKSEGCVGYVGIDSKLYFVR
jgi:hypothetical protein